MGGLLSPGRAWCLSCGKLTGLTERLPLCPACALELAKASRVTGTTCPKCHGVLFPGRPCRFCRRDREGLLDEANGPYRYRGAPRSLVLTLKFRGDTRAAALLAPAMLTRVPAGPFDGLVPVPLGEKRLRERGYNQAWELAELVSFGTGIPLWEGLVRVRQTKRQTEQTTMRDRLKNVADAFGVQAGASCAGRRFLLVDDVRTTGATALSCARALRQAGAAGVSLLTACIAPGLVKGRKAVPPGRFYRRR